MKLETHWVFFTWFKHKYLPWHMLGEGIIVYNSTYHPSNRKSWPPIGLLPIHLRRPWVYYFRIFNANFLLKSTQKNNLQITYYVRAFMLDEWEVHLYIIIISFPYTGHEIWVTTLWSNHVTKVAEFIMFCTWSLKMDKVILNSWSIWNMKTSWLQTTM